MCDAKQMRRLFVLLLHFCIVYTIECTNTQEGESASVHPCGKHETNFIHEWKKKRKKLSQVDYRSVLFPFFEVVIKIFKKRGKNSQRLLLFMHYMSKKISLDD